MSKPLLEFIPRDKILKLANVNNLSNQRVAFNHKLFAMFWATKLCLYLNQVFTFNRTRCSKRCCRAHVIHPLQFSQQIVHKILPRGRKQVKLDTRFRCSGTDVNFRSSAFEKSKLEIRFSLFKEAF